MTYKKLPQRSYKKGQVLFADGAIHIAYNTAEFRSSRSYVLDTLPGVQAKEGDTVICIRQVGSCPVGAVFQIARDAIGRIRPVPGIVLKDYTTIHSTSWCANCFRVLQPETQEPRYAVVTKSEGGFPVGTVIYRVNYPDEPDNWRAKEHIPDKPGIWYHALGKSCEWLEEDQQEQWTACKIAVTPETRTGVIARALVLGFKLLDKSPLIAPYLYFNSNTIFYGEDPEVFNRTEFTQVYWDAHTKDFTKPQQPTATNPLTVEDMVQYVENSSQNQQNKETQMKEKITIEIDANLVNQAAVEEDTRTDLGKCLPTVVLIFDAAGNYYDTVRAEGWSTPRKVKEQLQQPKYLGFTFKFFKLHKTYTTDIPIVEI